MNKNIAVPALAFATLWFGGSAYAAVSSSVLGEMLSYATSAETPGDMKYAAGGLLDSASHDSGGMANTSGGLSLQGVAEGQGGICGLAGTQSKAYASDTAVGVTSTSQVGACVVHVSSETITASALNTSTGSATAATQGTGSSYASGSASSSGSASISVP